MDTIAQALANSILALWLGGGFLFLLFRLGRRSASAQTVASPFPHEEPFDLRWLVESEAISTPRPPLR